MGSHSDFFFAVPDPGEDVSKFAGFFNGATTGGVTLLYRLGVIGYGTAGGVFGCGGTFTTGLFGPYSTVAGVRGTARDFTGVAGTSLNHVGVYGQVEDRVPVPRELHAGVLGAATTQPGVIGFSRENDGSQGLSFTGTGVRGVSFFGPAVNGLSGALTGVMGVSDTEGPSSPIWGNIAGVVGTSDRQPGVIGTSNTAAGVVGFSNNIGVYGEATDRAADYAGYFSGNVFITGGLSHNFTRSAVAFPDGTQRALYGMESPELWFEDFGAAKLVRGHALVKLDVDFVKVIKRGDYKVFLTPEGDCRGLYVRRGAASFQVRELMGGKSSIAFSYRIVGRRKDIKGHRRFAKIDTRLPLPAARARRPSSTLRAFIADLKSEARAKATPAMRKRDRDFAVVRPVSPESLVIRGPAVRKRRDSA